MACWIAARTSSNAPMSPNSISSRVVRIEKQASSNCGAAAASLLLIFGLAGLCDFIFLAVMPTGITGSKVKIKLVADAAN